MGTTEEGVVASEGLRVWVHAIASGPVQHASDGSKWRIAVLGAAEAIEVAEQLVSSVDEVDDHVADVMLSGAKHLPDEILRFAQDDGGREEMCPAC